MARVPVSAPQYHPTMAPPAALEFETQCVVADTLERWAQCDWRCLRGARDRAGPDAAGLTAVGALEPRGRDLVAQLTGWKVRPAPARRVVVCL